LSIGAVSTFQVALAFPAAGSLAVVFLLCLVELAALLSSRQAFYFGLSIGFTIYALQLNFFWNIFGAGALVLWLVLAFWIAVFLLLSSLAFRSLPHFGALLLIPLLWSGLEYFRSELYYLRFSWLTAGSCLAGIGPGVYFSGFLLMGFAVILFKAPPSRRLLMISIWICVMPQLRPSTNSATTPTSTGQSSVSVAGVQMEFPTAKEAELALSDLIKRYPEAQLLVLSEYTFEGPIPDHIRNWCRKHQRYLIAGGKDMLGTTNYFNTAFVVDPEGNIVFQQVKAVPIQFFRDGLPAPQQKVWPSPWGKIGLCVCYDLSYQRVTDELVRQGAKAIIAPTMDVADWGEHQHLLHARIAPLRAAEYGIPIFRVCSSGISQHVDSRGVVCASAPFPGDHAPIFATLRLGASGWLPLDHWLGPGAVLATIMFIVWLAGRNIILHQKTK
jgi:apolipoprotein N-acyltransferase